MKVIILAAGYATRLYPLTKSTAKALLEIADKPLIEYILDKVRKVENISQIYVITNNKFYDDFMEWSRSYQEIVDLIILNDGTTSNDNRLGAIGDISYVINKMGIDEDIMVVAADNLFTFDLQPFVDFFYKKKSDCITVQNIYDTKELQRTGVVEVDQKGLVLSFEEKPIKPRSHFAVPPLYLYKRSTLHLFTEYVKSGNNPDAPGNFIPWLIGRQNVYAHFVTGKCYDIGTLESYQHVSDSYRKK
ncbi:nucleotidyltransferase family protein [Gracilibacillus xinjiangensis]|uniref:Nucleotidyltransferase family protein n=1 Tax=Gracilibacillus xinjiangensis TaxID=1193282 RepID=A0ABV8WT61_9BACI